MDIFHVLFYVPIFNLMMFFAENWGGIGIAIILIAAVSKLVTYPLTKGQIEQGKKSKDLQTQVKSIQKQYKFNKEKMTQELAKVQAKALPGQLKGCVSIIIFIIFFIQIRGTIIDLVSQGYHAFNVVAYSQSLKKSEDSITINLPGKLPQGTDNLEIDVEASNGVKLNKIYTFDVVSDVTKRTDEVKTQELNKSDLQITADTDNAAAIATAERATDIAIFNQRFTDSLRTITLQSFLIFPTQTIQRYIMTDDSSNFQFFMRPPSGQTIVESKTKVILNGVDITSKSAITQGDAFGLNFLGMNLAKVATDFNLFDISVSGPYIALALLSAFTQYLVSKVYSAANVTTSATEDKHHDEKDKKKKKKGEEDEPDMATAMTDSLQTTNKILPAFTFILSMGYLGGASFLPSGVTLFWTAQNVFVIIQQAFMNRTELLVKGKKWFQSSKSKLIKVNNNDNGSK